MKRLCYLRSQLIVLFLCWLNISVVWALPSLGAGRVNAIKLRAKVR